MSKEYLEAFENLKKELYYSPNQIPDIYKWHEIIEEALHRLDFIDNTKPSEALEYLKELEENKSFCSEFDLIKIDIIRDYILKAQEQEKVLEIIKNKNVDTCVLKDSDTYIEYNNAMKLRYGGTELSKDLFLTEEEFNVVKEWKI